MDSIIIKGDDLLTTYEDLLIETDSNNIITKEKHLMAYNGRIKGARIAINKDLMEQEKKCVLAEELGHYYTTTGNILDQRDICNRKQEYRARLWGYNRIVGLHSIIKAYKHGCENLHDTADFLQITELYLTELLTCYTSKYGTYKEVENYIIHFEPYLYVEEKAS